MTLLKSDPKDLTIPAYGFKRYRMGKKMAVASIEYKGDKMFVRVDYSDEDWQRISGQRFGAYQSPTIAKNADSALRKIKQFFGTLEGVTTTLEI